MTPESNGAAFLVVGRDVDGSWTVREGGGLLLGRFATGSVALRFAERQRRSRPALSVASSDGARPRLKGRLSLANGRRIDAEDDRNA